MGIEISYVLIPLTLYEAISSQEASPHHVSQNPAIFIILYYLPARKMLNAEATGKQFKW